MYVGEKHGGSCTCTFFFFLLRSVFFLGLGDGGFDGEGGREVGTLKSRGIHTYIHGKDCMQCS